MNKRSWLNWSIAETATTATTAYDGVLLPCDLSAPTGRKDVWIDGSASIELNGSPYLPSSDVNANASMTAVMQSPMARGQYDGVIGQLFGCAATGMEAAQFQRIMMMKSP